jgi:hypothetical protein
MIERFWRSLKYECVYLHAFDRGSEANTGIGKWLTRDNAKPAHSSHGILPPNDAYDAQTDPMKLAAAYETLIHLNKAKSGRKTWSTLGSVDIVHFVRAGIASRCPSR